MLTADRRYWTADRATLVRLQRDFLPLDIGPVLVRHWISHEGFPWNDLQRRSGFTAVQMEQLRAAPWNERNAYSLLKTFYRVDQPLLEPLTEAFGEGFVRAHPIRRIPTYGPRPTGPLLPSPADAEMLKSLRSLGYLQ